MGAVHASEWIIVTAIMTSNLAWRPAELSIVYPLTFSRESKKELILANASALRADLSSCIPMMGNRTVLPPNWKLYHVINFSSVLVFATML